MTEKVSGNRGQTTAKTLDVTLGYSMKVFDELPKLVRDCLNDMPLPFSPIRARMQLDEGLTEQEVCHNIIYTYQKIAQQDREAGIIP